MVVSRSLPSLCSAGGWEVPRPARTPVWTVELQGGLRGQRGAQWSPHTYSCLVSIFDVPIAWIKMQVSSWHFRLLTLAASLKITQQDAGPGQSLSSGRRDGRRTSGGLRPPFQADPALHSHLLPWGALGLLRAQKCG